MNNKIASEIQAEQDHGRSKYGSGPEDLAHDDQNSDSVWYACIRRHNENAFLAGNLVREQRQFLIKVAGLAVSAIEAIDRRAKK